MKTGEIGPGQYESETPAPMPWTLIALVSITVNLCSKSQHQTTKPIKKANKHTELHRKCHSLSACAAFSHSNIIDFTGCW